MNRKACIFIIGITTLVLAQCGKKSSGGNPEPPPPPPALLSVSSWSVNGKPGSAVNYDVNKTPQVRFTFTTAVDRNTVAAAVSFRDAAGSSIPFTTSYERADTVLVLQPNSPLNNLSRYRAAVSTQLKSSAGSSLTSAREISLVTSIDSSRKFPTISDDALMTLVQQQTFKYFWNFAHPVSGLARERSNGSNETVTSGGSGFGIMAIIVGIERGFITRAEGLARMQLIVSFLKNTAETVKGAFPHWLNGTTGKIIPFSAKDDGADIVETSYLIQGLLCARQYFTNAGTEATLRNDINSICDRVEWDWFRKDNGNVLYWHYSTANTWQMNLPIRGWNECLITYVLAISSPSHAVPASLYNSGWAANGANGFTNGKTFYNFKLPLGQDLGGPLFFSHYSFLGIDPNGLADAYANYEEQTKNHSLINYSYCVDNPSNHFGYSDSVWGLTASDIPNSYTASSPTNDVGVIAPTAALSSFPFTPAQSMAALRFYYYTLGDRLFKEYGFIDAFALKDPWFAESFLAIDQGPIIIMIENHRTGLLWDLFTSCPEIKTGMSAMGFTAPYL